MFLQASVLLCWAGLQAALTRAAPQGLLLHADGSETALGFEATQRGPQEARDAHPCNIRRVYNSDAFSRGQLDSKIITEPVIFVRGEDVNRALADFVAMEAILGEYGSTVVELRSSNSYSSGVYRMTMSEYIASLQTAAPGNGLANETYYLFGGNSGALWDKIDDIYVLPGCAYCAEAGAVIPGLGGRSSGVSFHFHGPGFSEVVTGAKRWFLYPPSSASSTRLAPGFHPDMSVAQWVNEVYPSLQNGERPLECVIRPGEVLFFPDRWMHATLNVEDYVFFISLFLDPQLMVLN